MPTPTPRRPASRAHLVAFCAGWAAGDVANLRALPRILADALELDRVELRVGVGDAPEVAHTFSRSEKPVAVQPLPQDEGDVPGVAVPVPPAPAKALELRRALGDIGVLRMTLVGVEPAVDAAAGFMAELADLLADAVCVALTAAADQSVLGEAIAGLSHREWEICRLLETEMSEKEIAASISRSMHTLHSHIKAVYRKVGVRGRIQLLHALARARADARTGALATRAAAGWPTRAGHVPFCRSRASA